MAKKSQIEKNEKRRRLTARYSERRNKLRVIARNERLSLEDRFQAQLKLAELPRNSAPSRVVNRCEITGRPRAYYRKLRMSRVALRELSSAGMIPGMVKSSW